MSSAIVDSRVRRQPTVYSVVDLLAELKDGILTIPPHQREYCWTPLKEEELINTILTGLPIPTIIVRQHRRGAESQKTLEDGRQRLTCLDKFRSEQFTFKGLKFSDLTADQKGDFNNYQIPVLVYSNATDEQAARIFDNFQNGTPLTIGERLHSLRSLSAVTRFASDLLLTPGKKYHDRAVPVWGKHEGIGKRGNDLTAAVSLVISVTFGKPEDICLSKKYDDFQRNLFKDLTPIMQARAAQHLEHLFDIYEAVQETEPLRNRRIQWNHGNFTGPILYSLITHPRRVEFIKERWVNYLVKLRKKYNKMAARKVKGAWRKVLDATLHRDKSGARSWNDSRWKKGCAVVFAGTDLETSFTGLPVPAAVDRVEEESVEVEGDEEEESDDDDDSEESDY
jgi:hypothetical protein